MPAPYDYSINVQSPFEAAVSGLKLGATIADIRTQQEAAAKAQERQNMLNQGLRATVNSDDPAYFGGYIADNYAAVAGLVTEADMAELARNSFRGSFLDAAATAKHLAAIDSYSA